MCYLSPNPSNNTLFCVYGARLLPLLHFFIKFSEMISARTTGGMSLAYRIGSLNN